MGRSGIELVDIVVVVQAGVDDGRVFWATGELLDVP